MGIDPVTHAPRLDLLDISSVIGSLLGNTSLLSLRATNNLEGFSGDLTNMGFLDSQVPSCIVGNIDLLQQNQSEFLGDPTFPQNLGYDSVLSMPSSSTTPLNSSSTHLNNNNGEEERDSYCSDLFKFEILENLDLSDLL
ncbi:hypothetical protein K1719_032344 [Acacia pycnantha]|nr:hypothetical protein K1719_032344 [Acacia pycnantha]